MAEQAPADAPPQFLPTTRPVEDSARIPTSSISISALQEADLGAVASLLHSAFPDWWWRKHELPASQPAPDVRNARLATRLAVFLHHPDLIGVVAHVDGEFAGFAGWHVPRLDTTAPAINAFSDVPPSFVPCHFRKPFTDEVLPSKLGLSQQEWDEVWAGVDVESIGREFDGYDATRLKVMGNRPHWFLAPLIVEEKFRGRGVGAALMKWGCEYADDGVVGRPGKERSKVPHANGKGPEKPTPMFLDAFPNARPVYARFGFVGVEGNESAMVRE